MYFDELNSLFFSFSWDSACVIASLWRLTDDTKTEWGEPSTTISLGVFCSQSQGWKIAQSNNFYTFCVIRAAIPALIADLQLIKDLNWRCWWIIKAFRLKLRRFYGVFSNIEFWFAERQMRFYFCRCWLSLFQVNRLLLDFAIEVEAGCENSEIRLMSKNDENVWCFFFSFAPLTSSIAISWSY